MKLFLGIVIGFILAVSIAAGAFYVATDGEMHLEFSQQGEITAIV